MYFNLLSLSATLCRSFGVFVQRELFVIQAWIFMRKWKLFIAWLINFVSLIKNVEVLALGSCCQSWVEMVVPTAVGSLGIKVLHG